MRLTTKGRFAVTAMLDLAMNANHHAVKLNAISERQNISLSYLEQLFSKLRRAGLVESIRGPGGGYILGKPLDEINIAQIIEAAEDQLDATVCKGKANCQSGAPCLTHHLWENLNYAIYDYLSGVTLASLLAEMPPEPHSQVVKFTHIHV
ncbi:Fe-S cluster assembly transcriptional regulator IscR [Alysiella filiformis]|uniref:Transcriptional regulator, BadM/Rrf2 family n=1 Tax=Alysiella filiformis DSM 16848 TaxID=1120981 RepID=A0A286E1X8_9NEIS|nr:Fe-S cluster assembly transcriptional regulator IscR [Alysiella filiformis]QMT30824.1 Fe-S cluster assembly transcriptional regulator IscR [Alysiella filiformis]UBQ56195.1 Fe-S cluster assembly transcriptional regulator IscR [Alysiella filiformis DSM 16848]SOD64907.1 transcriptional regulator, BadM/Rrf2 family [Alysiella filiformis DSM 16848]